jgi:thioredoxin-like negative regulator of GroEL
MVVLVLSAAAANAAAASDRFVPADARFVVANVRQSSPDAALRDLITRWRGTPDDAASAALGAAFLQRAESLREPTYVGRAEAVLKAAAARAGASGAVRRLYAESLQYRHEFAAAAALLDAILVESPHDAISRQQRASVRLVRGDFAGARADCAQLLAGGGVPPLALACLAEAMAGSGQLERARALLDAYPLRIDEAPEARAYLLAVRAELHERDANPQRAIIDYSAALALVPDSDAVRAALADLLMADGEVSEAAALLAVERPSLALAVRGATCMYGAGQQRMREQATAWLELEAARGEALHLREAAMLSLSSGEPVEALRAARANFAVQKELADVRLLARAALATRDTAARGEIETWMRATGFRDAVTENMLAAEPRG